MDQNNASMFFLIVIADINTLTLASPSRLYPLTKLFILIRIIFTSNSCPAFVNDPPMETFGGKNNSLSSLFLAIEFRMISNYVFFFKFKINTFVNITIDSFSRSFVLICLGLFHNDNAIN